MGKGPSSAVVELRTAVRERAGEWCEMQLPGCLGLGTDTSHRIGTKAGGRHGEAAVRHHVPSNALWACRSCHRWCHDRPSEAKDLGLMLEEWQNPLEEPTTYRCRLVYLDDDGNVSDAA